MEIKNEIMYAAMATMLLNLGSFAFANQTINIDDKSKPRIEKQKPDSDIKNKSDNVQESKKDSEEEKNIK